MPFSRWPLVTVMLLPGKGELAVTLDIGSQFKEEKMRRGIRDATINDETREREVILPGMIPSMFYESRI